MTGFERDIAAGTDAGLVPAQLLAALGAERGAGNPERQQAIACFLSASEGWRDAAARLGGAFASDRGPARLKNGKAE